MLKPIVVFITLILTQSGCSVFGGYTDEIYLPYPPIMSGKTMNG
jgi:hypothetical protein